MIKKTRNKLIASLLLATMLIPAFSINAQAAWTDAPLNHPTSLEVSNLKGNLGFPNMRWEGNIFYTDVVDPYSGKTEITKTDPSYGISAEACKQQTLNHRMSLVQKCTAEANNPALPFIKVSMNDFLCIYGPMYGDAATKYESCNFDSTRYAADYPDVVAAVGNTHAALWNHYKTTGIYEGRRGYVVNYSGYSTNVRNIYWDLANVWTPQMTDREIVIWVNKWMCDNATYAYEGLYRNDEMEAKLAGGVQPFVCAGYATEFNYIMSNLGIPCVVVRSGMANRGAGHAWDWVFIDGQWKEVDVTWNDADGAGGINRPDRTTYLLSAIGTHPENKYLIYPDDACDVQWVADNIYSGSDCISSVY